MNLTQRDVGEIRKLIEASPYDELVLETATQRLELRRTQDGNWIQEITTLSRPAPVAPSGDETTGVLAEADRAASETREGLVNIHPPLPGTFYRAPKPGADPFVEIGAMVSEETVIGIIETMKLMNPARAGVAGEIAEICFENGTFVETSSVIMRVRPAEDKSS